VTDPNRLADATVTPELIDGLRSDYEHVIVAAPPLLPRSADSERGRRPGLSRAVHWRDHPGANSAAPWKSCERWACRPPVRCSLANRHGIGPKGVQRVRRTPNPDTVTGSIS
jgi:hypothetical protein